MRFLWWLAGPPLRAYLLRSAYEEARLVNLYRDVVDELDRDAAEREELHARYDAARVERRRFGERVEVGPDL